MQAPLLGVGQVELAVVLLFGHQAGRTQLLQHGRRLGLLFGVEIDAGQVHLGALVVGRLGGQLFGHLDGFGELSGFLVADHEDLRPVVDLVFGIGRGLDGLLQRRDALGETVGLVEVLALERERLVLERFRQLGRRRRDHVPPQVVA